MQVKIATMGSAPSSVTRAPFKNSKFQVFAEGKVEELARAHGEVPGDFEIWGCSPGLWAITPRATRWFEVHRWEPGQAWFSPQYVQFLRDFKGPLYVGAKIAELPNALVYPIDRMEEQFASYFFTSSLALMLALAIDTIEQVRKARLVYRPHKAAAFDAGVPVMYGDQNETGVPVMHDVALPPGVDPAELEKTDEDDIIGLWGVDMAACTSYDTRVLTADLRWLRADEVKVGDKLIAFDEEAQPMGDSVPQRRWRVAEVLQADRLMKPCYKLHLEDGSEIVCSAQHKWLTHAEHECRWKMAQDLVTPQHREGRPTRIVKLCNTWTEDRSWEEGYLAAAVDGEGHITQKLREDHYGLLRVGFSQRENAMSVAVREAAHRLGYELARDGSVGGVNGDCIKYSLRGGRAKTLEFLGRVRPRRLLEKFNPEHLGLMQKAGTVAVVDSEFLGEHPVIGLKTSTGTFVAEGLASHNSEEYGYQRPGCQFFVLEAMRRGIAVYLPPESDLMRPMPVYGISEWDHNYVKLTQRAREINSKTQEAQRLIAEQTQILQVAQGEMNALGSFVNTWTSPYGMQHGMVIRQAPGTGLGSGITHYDGRPVTRMTLEDPKPVQVVNEQESEAIGKAREFGAQLARYSLPGEDPFTTLNRIVQERDAAVAHVTKPVWRLERKPKPAAKANGSTKRR
jgi:hypothetical protein